MSNLQVWAKIIGSYLTREPTASPVLTKWWNWELILATNFDSHAQMVIKVGGQVLATKFSLAPAADWSGLMVAGHQSFTQNSTDWFIGQSDLKGWRIIKIWIIRPTLERRKTLGHLRSINPNMIIHFANQSQTCQLLKILKNYFQTFHEKKLWKVVQSISGWTDIENPYRLLRASYTYTYIYVEFLA